MMRTNLILVVWGLLVVAVDLNLDTFDVILDPVGFLLLVIALNTLGPVERSFAAAVPFAIGCLLPSILLLLQVNPGRP